MDKFGEGVRLSTDTPTGFIILHIGQTNGSERISFKRDFKRSLIFTSVNVQGTISLFKDVYIVTFHEHHRRSAITV